MLDVIIQDNLQLIMESIVLIGNRFSKINSADDLVLSRLCACNRQPGQTGRMDVQVRGAAA